MVRSAPAGGFYWMLDNLPAHSPWDTVLTMHPLPSEGRDSNISPKGLSCVSEKLSHQPLHAVG